MPEWKKIDLDQKLVQNVQESVLTRASAAIENAFTNNSGGFSRFPGLVQRLSFGGSGRVYLNSYQNDLIAVCSGNVYRIDQGLNPDNVTGVPVSGSGRVIFALAEDELLMAAGQQIISFRGTDTELLSEDAPTASHVAYINSFVVANEAESGRFFNSASGQSRVWDPVDVFAADGSPDNVTAIVVSPYRELLVCGPESVEQYEGLTSGDAAFARRWSVGEGILAPYTLVSENNGNWAMNNRYEFVQFTGQISRSESDDIGLSFEKVSDWTDAWAAPCNISGQKFIILQIPNTENAYGSKGLTLLHDYRQKRWYNLYGWNSDDGLPARWPGWSYQQLWGRHFVGGEGVLYELSDSVFQNAGGVQRVLFRTAHIDSLGEVEIDNIRLRVKRGVGSHSADPQISLRVNRDNKKWTRWRRKSLGKTGDSSMFVEFGPQGSCRSFQVEVEITDSCELELVGMQGLFSRIGD